MLNHSIFTYFLSQGLSLPGMREVSGALPADTTFCAGVPFSGGRALHTRNLPVHHYHNGMPFCENGALATGPDSAPAVFFITGSLGATATLRLAAQVGGTPTHFSKGFPLNSGNQICVPGDTPPVNTHAFSLGFDQGAFA